MSQQKTHFRLRWINPKTNVASTSDYWYCPDEPGNEAHGKTLAEYKQFRIAFGERAGFKCLGEA